MSEFSDDIKALRILLAEKGVEVTLERLVEVLHDALERDEQRDCQSCAISDLGLCVDCLIDLVKERP